jgi:hypothetical protein
MTKNIVSTAGGAMPGIRRSALMTRAWEIFRHTATKSVNCNQPERRFPPTATAKRAGQMREHSPGLHQTEPSLQRKQNDG